MANNLSDQLQIETTLNINIEHTIASVAERIVSTLIDYLIFVAYYLIIFTFFSISGISGYAAYVIASLPVLFYDLFLEITMDGQTWGKKVMKIKVVKADGSEPGFTDYLIRWIFRLLENVLLLGTLPVVLIIIRGKGQRLGDMAAGTVVVRIEKVHKLGDLLSSAIKTLDYVPAYESVMILTDKDINTIREVLQFVWKNFGTPESVQMSLKAQDAIEKKLDLKSGITPIKFLETIVKDYEYLHTNDGKSGNESI
jgi:uncharacterized RDD family membrane protein YckC